MTNEPSDLAHFYPNITKRRNTGHQKIFVRTKRVHSFNVMYICENGNDVPTFTDGTINCDCYLKMLRAEFLSISYIWIGINEYFSFSIRSSPFSTYC